MKRSTVPPNSAEIVSFQEMLRGQGGLRENFSEIEFFIVSDRGYQYLSDAFGPMKKYCS